MLENILNELNLGKELKSLYKGEIPIIDKYSMFRFYIEETKSGSFAHHHFSYLLCIIMMQTIIMWELLNTGFSDRKISFSANVDNYHMN